MNGQPPITNQRHIVLRGVGRLRRSHSLLPTCVYRRANALVYHPLLLLHHNRQVLYLFWSAPGVAPKGVSDLTPCFDFLSVSYGVCQRTLLPPFFVIAPGVGKNAPARRANESFCVPRTQCVLDNYGIHNIMSGGGSDACDISIGQRINGHYTPFSRQGDRMLKGMEKSA